MFSTAPSIGRAAATIRRFSSFYGASREVRIQVSYIGEKLRKFSIKQLWSLISAIFYDAVPTDRMTGRGFSTEASADFWVIFYAIYVVVLLM